MFSHLRVGPTLFPQMLANGGIGELAPLGQITDDHFDKLFDVDAPGAGF